MKQHLLSWKQSLLALTVLISAGLSSCNRAEYAMLPKTSSYHGTERVAVKTPIATPAPAVAEAPVATAPAAELAVAAPATTAKATAPAVAAAPSVAKKATASATPTAKPSFMQKMVVKKALKNVDKVASKVLVKKHKDVAESNKLSGKIRQGVILLLVGLLIEILGAATGLGIIYLLGAIIAIIGLVFIVLGLLDEI
ncbi:hypothetical protein [Hymenobacter guriensis]|uniref:DUF308 domain-containing protein n=1 Tax=Hymenobacter guriensis TaxID=2793065 RepID=A0ABS0L8J7_9BACT|nr:hypothetical protein [Hymenobacter guriensis]MBG8556447.1 hypothetical protein [Hymenobacter guriensis]